MRKLYFLVPGTTGQLRGGGLFAELRLLELAQRLYPSELVTYRQRQADVLFLDQVLQEERLDQVIFVMGWGFDTPKILKKLQKYSVIYHAHSAGYGFRVPPEVPIITVSRNTMGYWGEHAQNGLIYYLPNAIAPEFTNHHLHRDIDVLVQARKSSRYLLKVLIPALQPLCKVRVLDGFIEDLAGLFNRSKIYLYDSAEYWAVSGVTEGFGLPPLEALACGCQVFSSVNHGLADFLDPGFNCYKISGYSKEYDIQRILKIINSPIQRLVPNSFLEEFRSDALLYRLHTILTEINLFFDHQQKQPANITGLDPWRVRRLRVETMAHKVLEKLRRSRQ